MGLFVSGKNDDGNPVADSHARKQASIIHIDQRNSAVWIWVPELHTVTDIGQSQLFGWNRIDSQGPILFANIEPNFTYRGIAQLRPESDALEAQRSHLEPSNVEPLSWPDTSGTLKDLIDSYNSATPPLPPVGLVRAIALHASADSRRTCYDSLQSYLSSEPVPSPGLAGFDHVMRSRPDLFRELCDKVQERRMVFLLGGHHSRLEDFLDGFRSYLKAERTGGVAHVPVKFDCEAFNTILTSCEPLKPARRRELEALLTALAFCALRGIYSEKRRFLPDIFTAAMYTDPREFGNHYLATVNKHDTHWDSVIHFLQYLKTAAVRAGFKKQITLFLPFDNVERILNDRGQTRFELWEGMDALRDQLRLNPLSRKSKACPELGVVVAARSLCLDESAQQKFVPHAVLRIPPLSRAEVTRVVRQSLGENVTESDLQEFDDCTGGVPWFVHLVLRCIKTASPATVDEGCKMARAAVSGSDRAKQAGVPEDISREVEVYSDLVREILCGRSQIALGSKEIILAWQYPEDSSIGTRRYMNESERAWCETGLIWTQAKDELRGASLTSLRGYPEYRFSQAGTLPRKFVETVL